MNSLRGERMTIINRTDTDIPRIRFFSQNVCDNSAITLEMRDYLLSRNDNFIVNLMREEAGRYASSINDLPSALLESAFLCHLPTASDDFDYLRCSLKSMTCYTRYNHETAQLNFRVNYHTTILEEKWIRASLSKLFCENCVHNMASQYARAKFAYDYIVQNIRYDTDLANFSAYAALVKKRAVCSACAALLYRMLLMLGIPCRIITGQARNEHHAWNLISIDGLWYNADVTWDLCTHATGAAYRYFLVGDNDFSEHQRNLEYMTPNFLRTYQTEFNSFRTRAVNGVKLP